MIYLDKIIKSYRVGNHSLKVLKSINLCIEKGELVSIMGSSGSGKSTMLNILGILDSYDSGIYKLNNTLIKNLSERKAAYYRNQFIGFVFQSFNLLSFKNAMENVALPLYYQKVGRKKRNMKALEYLDMVGLKDWADHMPSEMSGGQKQRLSIARALLKDAPVLIMDEPTTVLTNLEVEILFELIRRLKKKNVTIVFISHKLNEVKLVCDRILVLRDGDQICIDDVKDVDEQDMAKKMVGRELSQVFPPKSSPGSEVVLGVENLSDATLLKDIHFQLKKGELLGFSGLIGAGRTELAECIMGLRPKTSGEIYVKGEKAQIRSSADALGYRLGYLSEDRKGKGLLMNFGIPENISLISLSKYDHLFINKKKEKQSSQKFIDQFNIKAASLTAELEYLSGGNQQKVYLSKWMDTEPLILILDEPTRGIDVNAKKEIYYFIHSLITHGVSCILISSELEEIIGLCSRVLVMREGRITGEMEGRHINEEEIMFCAAGVI